MTDKQNQISSANIVEAETFEPEPLSSQEEATEPRQIWFCELFRFANSLDYILMIVGSIAAAAMGTAMPAFAYIWGNMTDSFSDDQSMVEASRSTMLTFIYVGIGAFAAGWLMFACWMITGERQAISCRKVYLRSLLRQQIGWFDVINQTELASKFATDTFAFQGAIGQKISTIVMTFSTVIAGLIFAFITGWLMTLVLLATFPALMIAGVFYLKAIESKDREQQKAYAKAGGRAQQAISAIKTVKQLNGQYFEMVQYQKCLTQAASKTLKFALYSGLGIASLFFVMLASYALGFWFGSRCVMGTQNCPQGVSGGLYTAGDVLVVFFSIIMGGMNLSQLTPAFKKISQGRQAGARIFQVIDRQPKIKSPENGVKIQNLKGLIKFENVTFSYPKDPSRIVFKNLNLQFDINKTGLVGESGCGKSTTLQLIMRFYDPDEGRVTLDGYDLKTIDLIWLRQQIGYVGQQPVLFATSIRQNLLFGNMSATQEQIESALKMAECWDFIQSLEQKLDTYVGYGGGQLSGGQKQRIAIARAILRKPKIMLLDEATSALDRRNQKLIQQTLQRITEGMTTITVAHRVKTIMNSDRIYVLDKGGVKQSGKFHEISMFNNYVQQKQQQQQKQKDQKQNQNKTNLNAVDQVDTVPIGSQGQKKDSEKQDYFKTKEQKQKQYEKQLASKYDKAIFSRVFAYSKDKLLIFIIGVVASLAAGVIFPIFSIFLSRMLAALVSLGQGSTQEALREAKKDVDLYALIFFILGIISFVVISIQITAFGVVGEYITRRIRIQTFYKVIRMPVPWFDIPRNNAGTLTARLSTDCNLVNNVTTTIIGIMLQNVSTLISGIVIAFVHEWRTALVALGLLPFMILCGVIQMAFSTGFSDKTDAAYKDSSNLIMQAMINIRTVSSFGYEGVIANKYDQKMEEPYRLAINKGNFSGFFFGLSQIVMFTIFGVLFYLGSLFVRDNEDVSIADMFTAIYAILFAGMTAGNNSHFMPDTAACKNSAANLFQIQDSQDEQQLQIRQGSKLLKEGAIGDIVLENVNFKYQSRNQYVFKSMNLTVSKGTKVAFVGTSGCGKSTIIQLLQRFYFPQSGKITINNIELKDFQLHYLRSQFGVVSQEPVLFNGTFAENIRYNLDTATPQQISQAALKANALGFILGSPSTLEGQGSQQLVQGKLQAKGEGPAELQKGFDKSVGVRGSHVSGGQKQRVAIARTILRDPNMLLLDQATSALDSENEKKVQASLDSIMQGKTVISIAHRMETIKNSDKIFMFEKGKIIESGSYQELIAMQGHFYNLERGTSFT